MRWVAGWRQAIASAKRQSQRLALLWIDLDRFKLVNDTLGHRTGDELLHQISARIRGAVRASDTVARMGGDEFAVILTHLEGTARPEMIDAVRPSVPSSTTIT